MRHTNTATHLNNFLPLLPQKIIKILAQLQSSSTCTLPGSFYIYDLVEQQTLCASSSIPTLLGYTADEMHTMGMNGLANLIHPDDLQRVSEHYQHLTVLQWGEVICSEYRMQRSDGSWCWLRSQETPLPLENNDFPRQILGLIQTLVQPTVHQSPHRQRRRRTRERPIAGLSIHHPVG
ncbi:PAS domain-containing protein [Alkalinema pantanalense CENA528]|uniref:PAS domain-containing protein n=1 Tax=Alkalinema pantanalense TaxID=1620705 RepID=UPI003D7019BF